MKTLNPRQRHVRSLLWYHICWLDLKTGESQGPQPTIRPDDFDIPKPSNVDDATLDLSLSSPQPATGWTDTTFSLLRFECAELHCMIFRGRVQIDRGQMALHELRQAVASKKDFIKEHYLSQLDTTVPIQRYAQLVANLMFARCDLMILFRYLPRNERTQAQHCLRDM